jgi:major membrane immunogen (membrane-anchored lipoprotein)
MKKILTLVSAACLLAACGEVDQSLGGAKQDAPSYNGTGKAYVEPGWKAGDKTSWESKLKARVQYGQNEYSRVN